MGSLSGILQRPLVAATAVAVASFSSDLPTKFSTPKSSLESISLIEESSSSTCTTSLKESRSWVSHISVSKLANLSFVTRIRVPVTNISFPVLNSSSNFAPSTTSFPSLVSSLSLLNLFRTAELAKPLTYENTGPTSVPEVLYKWHLPEPNVYDVVGNSDCSLAKSRTVVVLLGWLGAKQKHLKRYAEWYTSRGFHAITFTFPMSEIISYQVGGKAEQDVELLVSHLADWLEEECGKNLVFHTFSNTGWLTYGVILEKFQKQDPSLMSNIRGCIVDSAPVASPDPQVWASGFSAAFLKKHSVATKGNPSSGVSDTELPVGSKTPVEPSPAVTEAALLVLLEKFFEVVFKIPTVNRRLSNVLGVLSSEQPSCPQLYIYSSADRVIPADHVESFIEEQRKIGREVRACNFMYTPHVDHFRNNPSLYTSQLNRFLEDCVLTCCKQSS